MPGYMDVPAAIKVAEACLDEKAKVYAKLDTIRSDLRNAVTRKEVTPEQLQWIEEKFPLRERKRGKKNDKDSATTTAATAGAASR